MIITIPDDILQPAQMSEKALELEIAILLYKQQKISSSKARAWTGLTVIEFQRELANRGLCLNYGVEDFQADIQADSPLSSSLPPSTTDVAEISTVLVALVMTGRFLSVA
jgi:predicted HTH domain antitoxin